eukprot:32681-Prymnesium_polylepis.1
MTTRSPFSKEYVRPSSRTISSPSSSAGSGAPASRLLVTDSRAPSKLTTFSPSHRSTPEPLLLPLGL